MVALDPPAGSDVTQIVSGQFDGQISAWARATAAWGHPVLLRLFAEMNTTAHDYALYKHPGNTPLEFRTAYQHVVNVWRAADPGRHDRFVFNPNRVYSGEPTLDNYWPGAGYVDWLAIDAYNLWDASMETRTVQGALDPTAQALRALPGAAGIPTFVAEIGATVNAGRPAWIGQIPAAANALGLKALVWWSEGGTRFDLDSASLTAARSMISNAPIVHSGTMPLSAIDAMTVLPFNAIDAWYWSRGRPSALRAPTGPETGTTGGRVRDYARGNVYWSASTGAHAVLGGILARYLVLGGPGVLGLPRTDETAVSGGRASTFTRGTVYWSAATGAHGVVGAILSRYSSIGGAGSTLGLPVTDEYSVAGGRRSDFQHGTISWSSSTGGTTVTG